MQFRKKKQLLEYLGKDGKDVRLIDRMMVKGLVRFEDGVYIYEDREKELLEENEKLKGEIESLSERVSDLEYELENAQPSVDYSDIYKRIYAYLKQVLHINVSYDDLVEFVENYPED